MKKFAATIIRCIVMAVLAVSSLAAHADEAMDTVFLYDSWESILYQEPTSAVLNPMVQVYTPYQVDITTRDDEVDRHIYSDFIAATLGDSTWLISGEYLKRNFKGDTRNLLGFMPLFFNGKVAFAIFVGYDEPNNVSSILFGSEYNTDEVYEECKNFYYIDFENKRVRKVDHKVMSDLLKDYHHLLMRYEGMKDYKKKYIIEDYFYKFIDQATADPMRPYILDLVGDDGRKID